jgi:succinylglutamate desuccinylase
MKMSDSEFHPMPHMLHEFHRPPDGLLHCSARELHRVLPGTSLLHWPGPGPRLFVSVLLHGNEDAGLRALQQFLLKHAPHTGDALPRALTVLVGNVHAARDGVRNLADQPDFNRIWSGHDSTVSNYHRMAAQIVARMQNEALLAVIDLHNNTGRNPLYSCVASNDKRHRQLATLFSPLVVKVDGLRSLTEAFSHHAPSICCECGEIGNQQGIEQATRLLERCMSLTPEELQAVDDRALKVFEAYAEIHVPAQARIGFSEPSDSVDLLFSPDIDLMNFLPLPAGQVLAQTAAGVQPSDLPLARNLDDGNPLDVFVHTNHTIQFKEPVVAAMLTPSEAAIRQTCLGYLMRPVQRDTSAHA